MFFPLRQQAPAPSAGSALLQMVPFLLVFFVFYYFLLLAPMRKQQKKTKEMLAALKKGDRVVTSGGIHGTVAQVEDQIVWVKIADTVKVKMNKSAISSVLAEGETVPAKEGA
ncbi:MAG: preprotein translocase subunit YajC [Acidobacteria bacterium]|nr:preprotein translocase subunit YajC [Acidobacteriota bacterium]